jgi:hypothetical protein
MSTSRHLGGTVDVTTAGQLLTRLAAGDADLVDTLAAIKRAASTGPSSPPRATSWNRHARTLEAETEAALAIVAAHAAHGPRR